MLKPPFNVKDKTHAYKYTKSVILVNSKPVKHPQMYQKISVPCLHFLSLAIILNM